MSKTQSAPAPAAQSPGAAAPQTQAVPFLTVTETGQCLFAVQPGIPCKDAHGILSVLTTVIAELLGDANSDLGVSSGHIAAYYLAEAVHGLVESLEDSWAYQEEGEA